MNKVNKILKEGGWKNPNMLFDIKKDKYPILVLINTGKKIKGIWHKDISGIETENEYDNNNIVAWKEYIPRKTFMEWLKERFK